MKNILLDVDPSKEPFSRSQFARLQKLLEDGADSDSGSSSQTVELVSFLRPSGFNRERKDLLRLKGKII